MIFKKTLVSSCYIFSILSSGYGVHCYLQDKTIGDLLQRLGKLHKSEEDFKKTQKLFKDNSEFNTDMQEVSSVALASDDEGWKLLKKWCDIKSLLPVTQENKEKVLPKAQKYCLDFVEEALISFANKTGMGWKDVKASVVKKGISSNGQLFVSFKNTDKTEIGRRKTIAYCWNTQNKNWEKSEGIDDCRKWD